MVIGGLGKAKKEGAAFGRALGGLEIQFLELRS